MENITSHSTSRTRDPPQAGTTLSSSMVLGALWLVSVFGNSLVCLVIHRSRRTQSTTNYFVVSLACADLLISVASVPFVLLQFTYGRWMLGNAMCKLVRYVQYLAPGVQIYVLLSICVDRFYTILYPLSFKVSREKAKKMILASWLFDAVLASPGWAPPGRRPAHQKEKGPWLYQAPRDSSRLKFSASPSLSPFFSGTPVAPAASSAFCQAGAEKPALRLHARLTASSTGACLKRSQQAFQRRQAGRERCLQVQPAPAAVSLPAQ
uniref:G protein-coupled receptor 19 n=1 Tax=Aquila chrysaetos chrysaetos TaxID=223781 RepID=A0A663EIP0_AQUCH